MELLQSFLAHYRKLAVPEQPALLAVSGGIDSMVLAALFVRAGLPCAIAHCNFGLRGASSEEDERFVAQYAQANKLPFHSVRFDTERYRRETGKGVQEAARDLRYRWLEETRAANGYGCIATAHQANDNAETLLMNVAKGCGIRGMRGILTVNGKLVRPLLFAGRKEIAAYAAEHRIDWREDATNATDDYTRNALRHQVMGPLEALFPQAAVQIGRSLERLAQSEEIYREAVAQRSAKLMERRGADWFIPVRRLQKERQWETMLYELLYPFGFRGAQLPALLKLLEAETGKRVDSEAYRVVRNREFLIVTAVETEASGHILIGEEGDYPTANGVLRLGAGKQLMTEDPQVVTVDGDRLEFPLVLRRMRAGDYFYPLGMGMKKKKLGRYLSDHKVAAPDKARVWVLESGRRIVWVAGRRLDERFRVKPSTTNLVQLEWQPVI